VLRRAVRIFSARSKCGGISAEGRSGESCPASNYQRPRMRPEVFWIDSPTNARLAIMPRPRSGDWLEDEIAGWRVEGIDVVVSLSPPTRGDRGARPGAGRGPLSVTRNGIPVLSDAGSRRTRIHAERHNARRGDHCKATSTESRGRPLPSRDWPLVTCRGMRSRLVRPRSRDGIRSHRQGTWHPSPGH